MKAYYIEIGGFSFSGKWSDCSSSSSSCEDCESAGEVTLGAAVIVFLLMMVLAVFSFLRRDKSSDKVTYKVTSILISIILLLACIIGMGTFNNQCIGTADSPEDYTLGPATNCMLTNFFFVFFILVVHALTAVNGGEAAGAPKTDAV